jgi:hypothetical protein
MTTPTPNDSPTLDLILQQLTQISTILTHITSQLTRLQQSLPVSMKWNDSGWTERSGG